MRLVCLFFLTFFRENRYLFCAYCIKKGRYIKNSTKLSSVLRYKGIEEHRDRYSRKSSAFDTGAILPVPFGGIAFFASSGCTYRHIEIEGGMRCEKENGEKTVRKEGQDCAGIFEAYVERAAHFHDAHHYGTGIFHDLCG